MNRIDARARTRRTNNIEGIGLHSDPDASAARPRSVNRKILKQEEEEKRKAKRNSNSNSSSLHTYKHITRKEEHSAQICIYNNTREKTRATGRDILENWV